jgi:hypothetical protein
LKQKRWIALDEAILRNLFAVFAWELLNDEVAWRYWRKTEDLWDSTASIPRRWLKLTYVYLLSWFAQTIPVSLLAFSIANVFKGGSWAWVLIGSGVLAVLGMLFVPLIAAAAAYDIHRIQSSAQE